MRFEEFETFWMNLNPQEPVEEAEVIQVYWLLEYYGDMYVYV